ncbi:haloacid dehalogenase-like hydrolase family protein, partial [Reticulomyxa filosa]
SFVRQFKVLGMLEFTAKRKRMTVLAQDEKGQVYLFCKGADSVVFGLCVSDTPNVMSRTKRHVTSFAKSGSRTLVMAWKRVMQAEYEQFDKEFRNAQVALTQRNEKIEQAFGILEHSLQLLGCTAVEDQMQEQVPETVQKLKEASIKVIMLTGDKQETAISIGRQSGIIAEHITTPQLMILSAKVPNDSSDPLALEKPMAQLQKKLNQFIEKCSMRQQELAQDELTTDEPNHQPSHKTPIAQESTQLSSIPSQSPENALVINGDALEMCLHDFLLDDFIVLFK